MTDVIAALEDLRGALAWPDDDADLTGAAVARLGPRRRPRRPFVAVAAVAAVGVGVPVAADRLSLGGVGIELTGEVPDGLGSELQLGEPAELRADAPRPPSLGEPAAAFEGRPVGGYTEVWPGPVLVTSFPGSVERDLVGKQAASVEAVTVDGEPAYWVAGTHTFFYVGEDGHALQDTIRLSGSALIWTRGDTTYRLEGTDLTLPEALRLAESMS